MLSSDPTSKTKVAAVTRRPQAFALLGATETFLPPFGRQTHLGLVAKRDAAPERAV